MYAAVCLTDGRLSTASFLMLLILPWGTGERRERGNELVLLFSNSGHMLTGSLKIVLLNCLWGVAINILTFQGHLNNQAKLIF